MKYLIFGLLFSTVCFGAFQDYQNEYTEKIYRGDKGNGGDSVVCAEDSSNDFVGTYQLDYLFALGRNLRSEMIEKETVAEYLNQIEEKLSKTIFKLSKDLNKFRGFIPNKKDRSLDFIWISNFFELEEIEDENLQVLFPENCRNIRQAVRRKKKHGLIQFEYHVPTFNIFREDSIQLSFMYIHEWLRKFTEDAEEIRDINEYLHSNIFYNEKDDSKIALSLFRMGIGRNYLTTVSERIKQEQLDAEVQKKMDIINKLKAKSRACTVSLDTLDCKNPVPLPIVNPYIWALSCNQAVYKELDDLNYEYRLKRPALREVGSFGYRLRSISAILGVINFPHPNVASATL